MKLCSTNSNTNRTSLFTFHELGVTPEVSHVNQTLSYGDYTKEMKIPEDTGVAA